MFKYLRVLNSKIWKNLTIETYTLFICSVNKSWIVHTKIAYRIIETNCPKRTKLTLLELTTNIRIESCLHKRLACARIYISIHSTETLCCRENIFMALMRHYTTLYSCHTLSEIKKIIIIYRKEGSGDIQAHLFHEQHVHIYHVLLPL